MKELEKIIEEFLLGNTADEFGYIPEPVINDLAQAIKSAGYVKIVSKSVEKRLRLQGLINE